MSTSTTMPTESTSLPIHPAAEIFPVLSAEELSALAQDIRAHGLQEPITVYEGHILDGRSRYEACVSIGVEPTMKEYKGDDPFGFVISANLRRRHLNESQRAMIAMKIAEVVHSAPIGTVSQEKAAKILNVSRRSVTRAKKLRNKATKEEIEAVEKGKKSLNAAVKELEKSEDRTATVDKTGYPVPEKAMPFWVRKEEMEEILRHISKARAAVRDMNPDDPMFSETVIAGVVAKLNQAYTGFSTAVPFAVCLVCQGVTPETCMVCKGRGVVSKFRHDTLIPEELKRMRAEAVEKLGPPPR